MTMQGGMGEALVAVRHVMVIDDEDDCIFVTRMVLKRAGFAGRVTTHRSGADALAWYREHGTIEAPDVLFVDINMPVMNGFEFLGHCSMEGWLPDQRTTVVMFSSSVLPTDIERARSFPFVNGYAEKALDVDRFINICQEHAERTG